MAIFIPPFDLEKWSPDKSDLTKWYYDLAKYIKELPILSEDKVAEYIEKYLDEHPIPVITLTNSTPKNLALRPEVGILDTAAKGDHIHRYPDKILSPGGLPITVRIVASNTYQSPSFWYGLRFRAEEINKDLMQIAITSGRGIFCRWYDVNTGAILENKYLITSINGKKATNDGNIILDFPDTTEFEERINGLETQTTQLTNAVGAINDVLPQKYSPSNQPPYPVTTVNEKTGNIFIRRVFDERSGFDGFMTCEAEQTSDQGGYSRVIVYGKDRLRDVAIQINNNDLSARLYSYDVEGKIKEYATIYTDKNPPAYPDKPVSELENNSTKLQLRGANTNYQLVAISDNVIGSALFVNGTTGKMTLYYDYEGPNHDTAVLYTDKNPPPYPVRSVNGKTGDIIVTGNVEKVSLTGTFSLEDAGYIITGVDASKIINVHISNYLIEWEGITNTLYVFVYGINSDGRLVKIDNSTLTFDVWRTT